VATLFYFSIVVMSNYETSEYF